MKTKTIIGMAILLISCTALAADSPFEKGKTYNIIYGSLSKGTLLITAEIKDVKDKWLLIGNQEVCRLLKSNECWFNTDFVVSASQTN